MAAQSNVYAGVAGYVGRPDEKGNDRRLPPRRRTAASGSTF